MAGLQSTGLQARRVDPELLQLVHCALVRLQLFDLKLETDPCQCRVLQLLPSAIPAVALLREKKWAWTAEQSRRNSG